MEEIICVDLNDRETGYMQKLQAHKTPVLHRAFSVFLVDETKILIQRRNKNKYHSGGLLANSCCSHQRKGEELSESVSRRLKEELGVSCEVKEVFDFVYFSTYSEDLYEYEFDHVFVGKYNGKIKFDPDEIEAVFWIEISELKEMMLKNPEKFSTWFMICAPRVIKLIENGKI
ncbi:MAG: isopentenyl-diphosphate Delta-isomerase [Clostridia bacterium]|nr:isopentenyl-diphosphate Delta-isomerase [Clostridia bacterium]